MESSSGRACEGTRASCRSRLSPIFLFGYAYPGAELARNKSHRNQQENHQDPESADVSVLAPFPKVKSHDREHRAVVGVEQNRGGELAQRYNADVNPSRDEAGHEQRQNDLP